MNTGDGLCNALNMEMSVNMHRCACVNTPHTHLFTVHPSLQPRLPPRQQTPCLWQATGRRRLVEALVSKQGTLRSLESFSSNPLLRGFTFSVLSLGLRLVTSTHWKAARNAMGAAQQRSDAEVAFEPRVARLRCRRNPNQVNSGGAGAARDHHLHDSFPQYKTHPTVESNPKVRQLNNFFFLLDWHAEGRAGL